MPPSLLLIVSEIVYGKLIGPTNHVVGTKVTTPVADISIIHPLTGIFWAAPEVIRIPLILVIAKLPEPTSLLSKFNGIAVFGVAA